MTPAESPWQQHPENPPPPAVTAPATPMPASFERKRPLFAGVLSGFPGMGNVYNGLYLRGFTLFLITISLAFLAPDIAEAEVWVDSEAIDEADVARDAAAPRAPAARRTPARSRTWAG